MDDKARNAHLEHVEAAAQRWSEARKEWQLRQTFSTRCALDKAGDELQAVLEGKHPWHKSIREQAED